MLAIVLDVNYCTKLRQTSMFILATKQDGGLSLTKHPKLCRYIIPLRHYSLFVVQSLNVFDHNEASAAMIEALT